MNYNKKISSYIFLTSVTDNEGFGSKILLILLLYWGGGYYPSLSLSAGTRDLRGITLKRYDMDSDMYRNL